MRMSFCLQRLAVLVDQPLEDSDFKTIRFLLRDPQIQMAAVELVGVNVQTSPP